MSKTTKKIEFYQENIDLQKLADQNLNYIFDQKINISDATLEL